MALSKVLQKMAEKHQTSETTNPPLAGHDKEPPANGAAGILLTLLTERQQKKTQSTPPPEKKTSEPAKNEESEPNTEKPSESPGKESGKSAASVLMQLLQKKKNLQEESETVDEEKTDHVDVVGEGQEGSPAPIVIEPLDGGDNKVSKKGDEEQGGEEPPSSPSLSKEGTPHSTTSSQSFTSLLCKICHRGFWDSEKLVTHMREEHGSQVDDPQGSPKHSPSPVTTGQETTNQEEGQDTPALRRSKRKRKPARMKYRTEEDDQNDDDTVHNPKPKILHVEGNVSMERDQAKSVKDDESSSQMSSGDLVSVASHVSPRPMDEDAGRGLMGEDSEEVAVTIEQITSYRCSKCYLYFNSHEETRRHLRQAHNVLTASMPPSVSPPTVIPPPRTISHSSCSTCGCDGHSKKSSPRHITCLICGRSSPAGMKNYINIFKVRTWSSRHHQLARRLSKTFGYKFTPSTCSSKHACTHCVSNLETIEKAKLLRMNMMSAIKRTKLVNPTSRIHSNESKQGTGSRADPVPDPTRGRPSHVPAAPLVRELLSAPEVVLPSSQFSELIDAIGSDKDSVTSSFTASTNIIHSPRSQDSPTAGQRSGRRKGKRVTASQHDDAAFSQFVTQLQSQNNQIQESASCSEISAGDTGQMGRVLAVVKVKEEPTTEDDRTNSKQSKSKAGSEIYKQLTAEKSRLSMIDPLHSMDEFRSSYTKLQIDSQSGQTEYNCVLCNNAFYSEEAIQIHVKCHLPGSKELHCFLCGFHNNLLPSQWRIMKRHLETEHEFPENYFHRFPCPVNGCADIFKCHKELVSHVTKVHRSQIKHAQAHALADLGLFDFPCPMCGTLLQSEAALEIHILCHNGSAKYYQCYYCSYMHNSQPGSWRIMRGHLTKEHVGKELASDTFSYYECPYYACRLKFCSKKAQIVHRACHDETKDGEFFCFHCHFSVPSTPYLWEKVKEHVIARHPEMVGEAFRCTCKAQFNSYKEFFNHLMLAGRSST